jgi:RHS repeat-associated protein
VFGRLIARTKGANTLRFYYSGWRLIEERDQNDNVLANYVYGTGVDEVRRMTRNGQQYYYTSDAQGNVTEITDDDGNLVEQYRYDAFGTPTIRDGDGDAISASAIGNRLMFQGRDRDPDTGLYNFRYRYSSPSLGRFLQPDPIGQKGELNLYGFLKNDPISKIDPLGLVGFPPGQGLSIPPSIPNSEALKVAVQKYNSACKCGDSPSDADCHTICDAFYGNISPTLVANCMLYCGDCDLGTLTGKHPPGSKK